MQPNERENWLIKQLSSSNYPLIDIECTVAVWIKLNFEQGVTSSFKNIVTMLWHSSDMWGDLIVFAAGRSIIGCTENVPGSMNGSQFCDPGEIYDYMDKFYCQTGGNDLVDPTIAE